MFPTRSWRLALCGWFMFTCARGYSHDPSGDDSNFTYVMPHSEHLPSIFSPRMDFEQWKPLTGRGDPLQNDPTYDYEPPKLERVHYWIDSASIKPEDKTKSEVLVLGVSSKKPSVVQSNIKRDGIEGIHKYMSNIPNYMNYHFSRPNIPPRHRPTSHVTFPQQFNNKVNYEDFSYKINDSPIPMTILVPPPPPPPGHIPSNFYELIDEQQEVTPATMFEVTTQTTPASTDTALPETSPSLSVQEATLIYQSSTVDENWDHSVNTSKGLVEESINSDYAGWGPTVPPELESNNDTHNLINSDNFEVVQHPYSFYRPMFSEAPPPPRPTPIAVFDTTTTPAVSSPEPDLSQNVVPGRPTPAPNTLTTEFQATEMPQTTFYEPSTESQYSFQPTPLPPVRESTDQGLFAMLGPMLGMPMTDGSQRHEDNLYAHGTENAHIFKDPVKTKASWEIELETMQTMQPPPVTVTTEKMPLNFPHNMLPRPVHQFSQNGLHKEQFPFDFNSGMMKNPIFKPIAQTPHSTTTVDPILGNFKEPVDINVAPMYLIIQGHSKVKTYSSKNRETVDLKDGIDNEIPQSKESRQVKHLHPLKDTVTKVRNDQINSSVNRSNSGRSLKKLVSEGVGSIEIQEAKLGIQYDVSDGSDVPAEIYRKGFVDIDENDYANARKNNTSTKLRNKRQLDLEDLLPDEDSIEEFVYNYLKKKSNEKSITGLIASAVTSNAAEAVDELEEDEDEDIER